MQSLQRLLDAAKVEVGDLTTQVTLALQQEGALKAEIRRLQRNDVRDTVNMEYLKNIVVRAMQALLLLTTTSSSINRRASHERGVCVGWGELVVGSAASCSREGRCPVRRPVAKAHYSLNQPHCCPFLCPPFRFVCAAAVPNLSCWCSGAGMPHSCLIHTAAVDTARAEAGKHAPCHVHPQLTTMTLLNSSTW